MNLLIGFLVSAGTVGLLGTIGVLALSRYDEYKKRGMIWTLILTVLYALVIAFCRWLTAAGLYGPTPLFGWVFIGAVLAAVASVSSQESGKASIPGVVVASLVAVYVVFFVWIFGSSDMMHAKEKTKLLGGIEQIQDISEVIQPADPAHICLVSEEMAHKLAQSALSAFHVEAGVTAGSRYEIGKGIKQYVDGQLWWIFPMEFTGYWKWSDHPSVPGYLRVSAENPLAKAEAVQKTKDGKDINIVYLQTAYFDKFAERYLRENGCLHTILRDWTFEVDESWRPYYTVSVLERTLGYEGLKTKGIILFDLQTGAIEFKDLGSLPDWVDRAIPLDVIDANLQYWGEYENPPSWWYTVTKNDMSQQPTDGWFMIYGPDGHCDWFSGWTSKNNNDHAMTGFTITNGRSGETHFVKVAGNTERLAHDGAKSLWSNFTGYEPTELAVYNIYGKLTYVIPMAYNGQFVGISLVSVENLNVKARGKTLEEALSNYRAAWSQSSSTKLNPNGGEIPVLEITGTVERVGTPFQKEGQQLFNFMLKGIPKLFEVAYTYDRPEVSLLKVGDIVTLRFKETKERVITCETFLIQGIVLTDENPVQARYLENQKAVQQETDRTGNIEQSRTLLNSDRMKKIDPKEPKKFLKEQSDGKKKP